MSEKIKAMWGHAERADEVKAWLMEQGANDSDMGFDRTDLVYFVGEDNEVDVRPEESAFLFDIVELPEIPEFKPFDKVLVRLRKTDKWVPAFFQSYKTANQTDYCKHVTMQGSCWQYCIPYEGNEHLALTTDEPKGGEK